MSDAAFEWVKLLSGILLGWFLGWGNQYITEYRTRRRLRHQLIEELTVLYDRVHVMQLGYVRSLQCLAHGIADNTFPLKLEHPIYTNFYKDVCSHLSLSQRTSYEFIHGLVETINLLIDEERSLLREINITEDGKKIEHWGSGVKSQFINISALRWYIHNHLEQPNDPTLDADAYREDRRGANHKVEEILAKAKNLDIKGEIHKGGGSIRLVSDKS